MINIIGRYCTAKVMTNNIEDEARKQIETFCNQPMTEGSNIAIMPDVHAGSGCTIGTTSTITDKVIPNLVGVDIGCGMETSILCETEIDLVELDKVIHERIPAGFNIRETPHTFYDIIESQLNDLHCFRHVNYDRAMKSIGTLGGGNHFIEVDRGSDGSLYLVVHSGSRHLGIEVASYYQAEARRRLNNGGVDKSYIAKMVAELKAAGRHSEIQTEIQRVTEAAKNATANIPPELAYCEGELFVNYIEDMKIVQRYASLNRQAMLFEIADGLGLKAFRDHFSTIHNYIDTDAMILRKGAVSAKKDEKLLIPINMRDGSLICTGKGNPEWNYSAPHGAGRIMSRRKAKENINLEEYKASMEGIYTTTVDLSTIDEAPMAYKPMDEIIENIKPTADIIDIIKPVYNFKAGE